jgi:hypothetical protein
VLRDLLVVSDDSFGRPKVLQEGLMIDGSFDPRTLANMEVALDRVCANTPKGEEYAVRKPIAQAILRCARSGRTTLGALTQAGERVRARNPDRVTKSL